MNLLRKPNRSNRIGGIALALVATSLLTMASVGISAFSIQVARPGNPSGDLQQFVGTWTASHEGTPFLILELHSENGSLAGGIRVCSFNLDMKNGTNNVTITDKKFTESLPVNNLKMSDNALTFDWKDPDGDQDHWKLEVNGGNAGRLSWVGLPDEMKVAPIQVTGTPRKLANRTANLLTSSRVIGLFCETHDRREHRRTMNVLAILPGVYVRRADLQRLSRSQNPSPRRQFIAFGRR